MDSLNLVLLNLGKVDLDARWDYENVISPFSRLYLITKGKATVYHHGQAWQLEPGHLYLIPSYTYSRYKCDGHMQQYYVSILEESTDNISIYDSHSFEYKTRAEPYDQMLFDRLLDLNPDRSLINDDPETYDNMPMLLSFKNRNDELAPAAYLETQGILRQLLSRFVAARQVKHLQLVDSKYQRIAEALKYIGQNLQGELSVKEVAQSIYLNTDYFSRIFHEYTGMRPVKYIQSRRVSRAQLLLATTTIPIDVIARKVGLNNLSYFSRLFKTHVGMPPVEYRKAQWENGQI